MTKGVIMQLSELQITAIVFIFVFVIVMYVWKKMKESFIEEDLLKAVGVDPDLCTVLKKDRNEREKHEGKISNFLFNMCQNLILETVTSEFIDGNTAIVNLKKRIRKFSAFLRAAERLGFKAGAIWGKLKPNEVKTIERLLVI